ncbi:polymerase [Globisporangium polare]
MGCVGKWTSVIVLVAVNCVLVAGGILVLVVTLRVRDTGWVDVVRSYLSSTDAILTAIEVVAIVVIALAVLGSLAALCRWRAGLLIYSFIVFVLLLAFVAITVAAFLLRGKASDWEGKTYPATSDEVSVKRKFDLIYCAAQGAYICNSLTVADAIAMFAPQLNSSTLLAAFSGVKGVGSICDTYLTQVVDLKSVCDGCAVASEFKNLSAIFDWANDRCPRTTATLLWCGTLLSKGSTNSVTVGTAPYSECRVKFLGLVENTALYLGLGGIIVSVGALVVVIYSCYLRRQEKLSRRNRGSSAESEDLDGDRHDQGTPTAAHAMYNKA